MPRIPYLPPQPLISPTINKKIEDLINKPIIPNNPNRIKEINRKAALKRAKNLGIDVVPDVGVKIRSKVNERIIQEIKKRKLKHIEVSSISLIPRTKITAIMNRKLNKISTDSLLILAGSLGISIDVKFS